MTLFSQLETLALHLWHEMLYHFLSVVVNIVAIIKSHTARRVQLMQAACDNDNCKRAVGGGKVCNALCMSCRTKAACLVSSLSSRLSSPPSSFSCSCSSAGRKAWAGRDSLHPLTPSLGRGGGEGRGLQIGTAAPAPAGIHELSFRMFSRSACTKHRCNSTTHTRDAIGLWWDFFAY